MLYRTILIELLYIHPFQIVGRFGKYRYINFAMHLDKHYV
jgi:hypothetical protein